MYDNDLQVTKNSDHEGVFKCERNHPQVIQNKFVEYSDG